MANDKANVHSDTFNCRWESFHVIYDAIVSCIVDFVAQFGKHGVRTPNLGEVLMKSTL